MSRSFTVCIYIIQFQSVTKWSQNSPIIANNGQIIRYRCLTKKVLKHLMFGSSFQKHNICVWSACQLFNLHAFPDISIHCSPSSTVLQIAPHLHQHPSNTVLCLPNPTRLTTSTLSTDRRFSEGL